MLRILVCFLGSGVEAWFFFAGLPLFLLSADCLFLFLHSRFTAVTHLASFHSFLCLGLFLCHLDSRACLSLLAFALALLLISSWAFWEGRRLGCCVLDLDGG